MAQSSITNPTVDRTTPLDASGTSDCDNDQQEPTVATHPDYQCRRPDYILIDDCLQGERQIKSKGTEYLPPTSGMKDDSDAYAAYLMRSVYFNYAKDTLDAGVGMLQREPAVVQLPKQLEPIQDLASPDDDTLQELLEDVHEGQLRDGRYGLLVDVPETENPDTPHIAKYTALTIINWWEDYRDGVRRLRMVVLNESSWELSAGGQHEWIEQYRICALDSDDRYWTAVLGPADLTQLDVETFNPPEMMEGDEPVDPYPNFKGTKLEFVPFVFVNVSNLEPPPQVSPILDVANLCISIYRGEADYRQALFMQGQATPYGLGLKEDEQPDLLGANSFLRAGNPDAEFGFLEVEGKGLTEMRESQDDLKEQAAGKGVALTETGGERESGRALSIRVSTKTSLLKTIALTGASGVLRALEMSMAWIGSGELDTVEGLDISPNTDFVEDDGSTTLKELKDYIEAQTKSGIIRDQDIWEWMLQKDLVTEPWEDVAAEIEERNGNDMGNDMGTNNDHGSTNQPDPEPNPAPAADQTLDDFGNGEVIEVGGKNLRLSVVDGKRVLTEL